MTTTMVGPAMLTVLIHIFLVSHGVRCWEPDGAASLLSGVVDLPWQDELCCDSPPAHLSAETNHPVSSLQYHPHCTFMGSITQSAPSELSHGTCLEILCRIDEDGNRLTCELHSRNAFPLSAWRMAVSLEHVTSQREEGPDNVVVCEAEDSFTCSAALTANTDSFSLVISSNSTAVARPVRLRVPVKPSPPVNLSHEQTIEAELIFRWDPPKAETRPLIYEVRYAGETTPPAWQMVSALTEPKLALDLEPECTYSIQVRCSSLDGPALWSDWSEPHYIRLNSETYIPDVTIVRPGETVTVYCVFNNRSANASMAAWILNHRNQVQSSNYQAVNQWVSKVTLQASENQMLDVLQCQKSTLPYSAVYIEGASVNITCTTNGDIDAMDCHWKNPELTAPSFMYSWAEMDCDVMERRERDGEEVGEMGSLRENCYHSTCKIFPLSMNCYKVWLEMPSKRGRVKSKPIYLSPIDHVKPNSPTGVEAVSQNNGFLNVTWVAPQLPTHCQCQFQYRASSTVRAQQWKVQREVLVSHAAVRVDEMCRVYEVQVRCKHEQGTGEWSEWSKSTFSKAQNDNAPERGPDFWRILRDHPGKNQTHVTLLLRPVQMSGAHCVDGFVVRRQTSSGSVVRTEIEVTDSYSFEWDQSPQTVTVEAHNSLGSSAHNFDMTLEKQPRRRCVHSFSVLVINNTFVSLSWTLLDSSSVPIFMVVQWFSQKQHDSSHHKGQSRDNWARLPYSDRPTYLRGDFFSPEEYDYHLFPVLADGECEPAYATATRRDPAAYMLLMIISFLSVVLFVSLLLSQNQMKKFVWKDVPNPNKCSWAKGVDFRKTDNFDPLFRPAEGLPAWPLFPPCENISNVVIEDKTELSALTTALIQTPTVSVILDPATCNALPPELDQDPESESDSRPVSLDALTSSGSADSSGQSSVTYATVLLSDPKQEQLPIHLHSSSKDTSGSSSSDEGNFSANNSDISGSLRGSCPSGSYNSVEKMSDQGDEEEDEGVREVKDLCYVGMDYPAEDEASDEEEEQDSVGAKTRNPELLKNVVLTREARSELHPLLSPEESNGLLSPAACGLSPLYLPQFRTVQPQDAV